MFGRKHAKDEAEQFDYSELLAFVRPLLVDRLLPLFTSMSDSGPLSLHGFTDTVRGHDEAHIVEYMNTVTAAFGINKLESFSDDDRHVIDMFMHYDVENNSIDDGVFNPDFYTLYDEFLSKYHSDLSRAVPDAFGGVDVAPASKASLNVFARDDEPDDAALGSVGSVGFVDNDDDDNIENEPLGESDDEAAARAAALLSADEDEAHSSDTLSGALDEDEGPERNIDEIVAAAREAESVTQPESVPEFGAESVSVPVSQPQETRYMTQAPQGVNIKTSEQLSADDLPSMDLKTPNAAKPDTSMNDIVASAISAAQRADNTDPFEDKTEVPDALPVSLPDAGIDESSGFVATMNTTIIEDDPDEFDGELEESDGFDEPDEEFDGSDNDDFGDEPPEEEISEPVEVYNDPEDFEPDDLSADGLDDEIGAAGDEQHLVGESDVADVADDDVPQDADGTEDDTDDAPDTTLNPPSPPAGFKSREDMKTQNSADEAVTPMDVDATDAIAYQRPMTEILMSFGVLLDNVGHTRVGAKNVSAPGAASVNPVFPSRFDDSGERNESDSGNGGQQFQRNDNVKIDEKDKMIDENGVIMDF